MHHIPSFFLKLQPVMFSLSHNLCFIYNLGLHPDEERQQSYDFLMFLNTEIS